MKRLLTLLLLLCFVFSFAGVAEAGSEEDTSSFYLVAGSYREKENAIRKQEELYKHRYYARLMGYPVDGELFWRVVVMQSKEREEVEGMKELLAEDGFEAFIAYDKPGEPERPVKDPEPIPVPEPEPTPDPESKEVRAFILELIDFLYRKLESY